VGEPDLGAIAAHIADGARRAEQVEVYVGRSTHTEVRVFGGDVESLSSADTAGIGVRVIVDGRQGFAFAGSLDPSVTSDVLAEARDNAAFATPDEFLGLAQPDGVEPARLSLSRDDLDTVATEEKVRMALAVEQATFAADPRIRAVESAGYGDTRSESAIFSTAGIRVSSSRTTCSVYAHAVAGGTDNAANQTGYGYSVGRHPDELDIEKAASDAGLRATRLLGSVKPSSRRVTAVFDPVITARFLGVLSAALSAEAAQKGRSLFTGMVGEVVAASTLCLTDDPSDARAFGASRFDAEGLASRRNCLIEGGRLTGFLHNSYTARKAGVASNACAVRGGYKSTPGVSSRALALVPGTLLQDDLIRTIDEGLLVLSISGLHSGTNPVSGDFSVGVEGIVIRRGELAEPIREATVASTLSVMLNSIEGVGADVEWLRGGAAGVSLVVADLTLSGT